MMRGGLIMKRKYRFGVLLLCFLTAGVLTVHAAEKSMPGSFGFEYANGSMGSFSFFQAGLIFPRINNSFSIGVAARICSSLTWATFINMETEEAVSFHPVLAAGILSFRGNSPMIYDVLVMYGGTDLLAGYTFTPYDELIYGTGNLLGENFTFGIIGYFGLELLTGPKISFFTDVGGGFKTISGDKTNQYIIGASWLGSGFSYRTGLRFYL